jgi:hypothetical protein
VLFQRRSGLRDLRALADALEAGDELPDEAAPFLFRLHSTDYDVLGQFSTPVPNCEIGDEFTTVDGSRYRIRHIVPLDIAAAFDAMFQVEPA